MENKIELRNTLNTYAELKECAQIYYKCLNLDAIKLLDSPSLKYALFNLNLYEAFKDRIKSLNLVIEKLRQNLKNYKGKKIDSIEELKKLDEISHNLIAIEKQSQVDYDFYKEYLTGVAGTFDSSRDNATKSIYIKSSEEIIISRIKYYLNSEKKFLIFKDIIKELTRVLNF